MYNTTNKMGANSGEGRHGFAYPSQFWYIDGMLIHAICNAGHITFRIFSYSVPMKVVSSSFLPM